MNFRTTYILLGTVFLGLVALGIYVLTSGGEATNPLAEGYLLRPFKSANITAEKVTALEIEFPGQTPEQLTFVREEKSGWKMTAPSAGRADAATGWGASLFVQVLDPAAFGGGDGFLRETGWLADACRGTPVRPGDPPVRVPGDGAMARRAEQSAKGVVLHPGVLPSLKPWCEKMGVRAPKSI